jgi:D-arabinose 1-dehydrogenase-like Zn-dependent alcohol dehydrogenase
VLLSFPSLVMASTSLFDMPSEHSLSRAIVARGPQEEGKWVMEEIRPGEIGDNELLVQMVASGICHTDLHVGNAREEGMGVAYYPRVLGHEGKGTGREGSPLILP